MISTARPRLELDVATSMLLTPYAEACVSLEEGGIPIGAALFDRDGVFYGAGHNRRVQDGDPSLHAETDAFRSAGRRRDYPDLVMATTLSPCWYCAGLIRQFNIGTLVVGDDINFQGAHQWLADLGVEVHVINMEECVEQMATFIEARPDLWHEDIGL